MAEDPDALDRLRRALASAQEQQERDRATIAALYRERDENQREAQHQVRNILSVVRSIARRTVEENETAEEYQARLDSRLASFTNLQCQIARDPAEGIDLCNLVDGELIAFGIKLGDGACFHGDTIRLKPRPASVLGLAFHELARMAIEGGASAGLDGRIDVQAHLVSDGAAPERLEIVWIETGRQTFTGPKPDPVFGREVVEQAIAYDIGGEAELHITPDGLNCRFELPVGCLK